MSEAAGDNPEGSPPDATTATREVSGSGSGSAWAPLRSKIFLSLFIAQLVSNLGTNMQMVGSAWLLGDLGATPAIVAMVQTATFLPVFLVGIPAGVLADLFDRRLVLIWTQMSMMVAAAGMAVFTFAGAITPLGVLALTFALGTGMVISGPAWQAIQPDLVEPDDFPQAISLSSMTFNVGRAVGPAIGGFMIAGIGAGWVFAFNAASFLGTIWVLYAWQPEPADSLATQREPWTSAAIAGLRYTKHQPLLRAVLVRTALLMFPAAALAALLPVVVRGPLDWSSNGYGILLGIYGLGAVVGAIVRPSITARLHNDSLMVATTLAMAGVLIVQGAVTNRVAVGAAQAVGGFALTLAATTVMVAAQQAMPSWVRARGLGLFTILLTGSIALGSVLWGFIANGSIVAAHIAAAAMMAIGALGGVRWKLTWARSYDLTTVAYDAPNVLLQPDPTDGPVMVTVAYHVPPDRIDEFAELMRGVQPHRRRTGAYDWGLYRDLREPTRFVETYLVSSWAEHLRQRQRLTVAVAELLAQLRPFVQQEGEAVGHWISATSPGGLTPFLDTAGYDSPEGEVDA